MDGVPDQLGSLLLNDEGAVLSSSGQLENDEKSANVIMGILNLTACLDPKAFPADNGFKRISVVYDDHCYVVCLSNRRIYVVKRRCDVLDSNSSNASA